MERARGLMRVHATFLDSSNVRHIGMAVTKAVDDAET